MASWQKWLPAVLLLSGLEFIVYLLFVPDFSSLYYIDDYTGKLVWSPDAGTKIPPMVAGLILVAVLGMVVSWVFVAIAIAGLRNRPVTVEQIVVRGLLTLGASLLLSLAVVVAMVPVAVVLVAAPPLGILLIFAAIFVFIYVEIRLIFFNLAIFDGFGPIEGLRESWRLSQGSVGRLFGWGLMAALIGMVFSIVAGFISTPLTVMHANEAGQAVSYVVQSAGSCFTVFLMAVLYESQRARLDPTLYPYPAMPPYPGPQPGAWGPAPYPGPQPGPWGPAPYTPAPGWPGNPDVPPGWPPSQTGAPGWPANPNAAPLWVSNEPGAQPPTDGPKPPEPPASS